MTGHSSQLAGTAPASASLSQLGSRGAWPHSRWEGPSKSWLTASCFPKELTGSFFFFYVCTVLWGFFWANGLEIWNEIRQFLEVQQISHQTSAPKYYTAGLVEEPKCTFQSLSSSKAAQPNWRAAMPLEVSKETTLLCLCFLKPS